MDLQNYGQTFSGVLAITVKDLNALTVDGYPLQAQNASISLDEYQANNGGQMA